MNVSDSEILDLLRKYKKITVIGMSRDANKPAQKVPLYAKSRGYDLVGVNPNPGDIAGFKCFEKLADVPAEYRKFVDVFRPAKDIPQVVEEVLKVGGVEVLFIQLGITDPVAEKKAEAAGIKVISDRCLHLELAKIK